MSPERSLSGSLADFSLEQILWLLESGKKTGVLEVGGERERGALEITDGALTGARWGEDVGEAALGAVFGITAGEFRFQPGEAGPANLTGSLDDLLRRADDERARFEAIRRDIPDERMRFTLSDRAAAGGTITITSDQWRVLREVNGERDVLAIAADIGSGRLTTLRHLHALYTQGLVDVRPPAMEEETRGAASAPVEVPSAAEHPAVESALEAPAVEPAPSPAATLAEPPPAAVEAAPPPMAFWAPPPPEETPPEMPAPPTVEEREPPLAREDRAAEFDARLAALGLPSSEAPAEPAREPEVEAAPAPTAPDDFWARVSSQQQHSPPLVEEPPAAAPAEPSAIDDRLAALFGRGPSVAEPEAPVVEREAPAAEPAPPTHEPEVSHYLPPDATAPILEAPPPAPPPKKGLFGMFKGGATKAKEDAGELPLSRLQRFGVRPKAPTANLATLANVLLDELNTGKVGSGRILDHMLVRLRLVDEQADPLDRPLPLHDDRLDAAAIERGEHVPEQVLPYLAQLIRQIYDDGEKAFGKDKAKRAYRSAVQQALGADESILADPAVAPHLPKV